MSDIPTPKTDSLPWCTCQTKDLDWVRCVKREDCREIERKLIAIEKECHELKRDLAAESSIRLAEWCKEEREAGNGGCGACSICCEELRKEVERRHGIGGELIIARKERDELLKACQDLKAKSVVDAILYERKIDALAKIVVKCRNSNGKQWKPVTRGGADSYLGLPLIMRDIDAVLVQVYGTSDLSNIPEMGKALSENDGKVGGA